MVGGAYWLLVGEKLNFCRGFADVYPSFSDYPGVLIKEASHGGLTVGRADTDLSGSGTPTGEIPSAAFQLNPDIAKTIK